MPFATWTLFFTLVLFLGSVGCVELGRRLRARRPQEREVHSGVFDAAVYGLVGLLFAFTFQGAAERFLERRALIGEEATAISTAWARVDLVQRDRQGPMREAIKRYLDARLGAYANPGDQEATARALEQVASAREHLWRQVVESLRAPEPANEVALAVPMNQMFDIGDKRVHTTQLHPPNVIYALLAVVSLIAGLLGGYTLTGPPVWLHTLIYAGVMALTVFVIVELEYPRLGVIRVTDADEILFELRATMNEDYRSSR